MAHGRVAGGAGLAAGSICTAIGAGTAGIGGVVCVLVVIGAGSYGGSKGGEWAGELAGEEIYKVQQ